MLVLALSVVFLTGVTNCDEVPSVKTPLGVISGSNRVSSQGRVYSAFEGIPYAKPPIGELRFEEPEAVQPWKGVWNASFLTECPQVDVSGFFGGKISGQEDCLYMNIYVPRKNPNPDEKLDVVFHIHGGAYMVCSGHFFISPVLLMDRDVVFVTFNYRLGALGFLSTEDDVISGNNGLKDQVLALKWVQENIASFGGNPNSVTITGISAGSSSVHFHYLMPQSRNLFHRGVAHSGVALNPWSIQDAPLQKAKFLAAAVGCPSSNSQALKSCLKSRPFQQITESVRYMYAYKMVPLAPFAPVVEKGSNPFVRADPYKLLLEGEINDVPIIFSTAAHEGYFNIMMTPEDLEKYEKNWEEIAPHFLEFNYTVAPSQRAGVSQKIRDYYLGDKPINEENLDHLVELFGDRLFLADADTAVKLHAKASKSPVYYYSFAYPGDNPPVKYVPHGGDAAYYYGNVINPTPFSENQKKLSKSMIDMLLSFAKTGVPVFEGIDWLPTDGNELTYLNIASPDLSQNEIVTVQKLGNTDFWKSLGLHENENLLNVKDEL